jgi:hypothetical protein
MNCNGAWPRQWSLGWDLHSQLQDQPNSDPKFYSCLKSAKPSPHLMTEIRANLNIMEPGLYLPLLPDSIFIGTRNRSS